jgi:hypothetical protein
VVATVALDVVAGRSVAEAMHGVVAVMVVEVFYYFCEMFIVHQRHFFLFFEMLAMRQRLSPRQRFSLCHASRTTKSCSYHYPVPPFPSVCCGSFFLW